MSRIGRQPITIPAGVQVTLQPKSVEVTGPKGTLTQALLPGFELKLEGDQLSVAKKRETVETQKYYGLMRTLIANMIIGVSEGFSKQLEINGVGFRVQSAGRGISLSLGFSHKIDFEPPETIELKVEGSVITVSGVDKQLVGETAAKIRSFKKPEPYKGKGIRYIDEYVRRKAGKTAAKG